MWIQDFCEGGGGGEQNVADVTAELREQSKSGLQKLGVTGVGWEIGIPRRNLPLVLLFTLAFLYLKGASHLMVGINLHLQ